MQYKLRYHIQHGGTNLSSFEGFFWSSYDWYKMLVDAGPHLNRFLLVFLDGLSCTVLSTSEIRRFPGELYSFGKRDKNVTTVANDIQTSKFRTQPNVCH